MVKLFQHMDIETVSTCNRTCPMCLRNSHPNKNAVKSWFTKSYLPMKSLRKIKDQLLDLDFSGTVCLSHYNEPLTDERLPEIAKIFYSDFHTYFHTNGDLITSELAELLDGRVHRIVVSLYQSEPIASKRAEWITSLFSHTEIQVRFSKHIVTHYSPHPDLQKMISAYKDNRCLEPQLHCIINHRGEYLLCCDDMVGNFHLGSFPELRIEDYWFGPKHSSIYSALKIPGGRELFSYCETCPRE